MSFVSKNNLDIKWEEWSHKKLDDLYWFCLRRNFEYHQDFDHFKKHLGLYIQQYVKDISLTADPDILVKAHGTAVPASYEGTPQEPYDKIDIENIDLLNQSYLAFVAKWRVYPCHYGMEKAPPRLKLPQKFHSTSVITVPGEINFNLTLVDSEESILKNVNSTIKETSSSLSSNISGFWPQKNSFDDIKFRLFIFNIWESHQNEGVVVCSSSSINEDLSKSGWPKEAREFYQRKRAPHTHDVSPNLRKDLQKAHSYICNPAHIIRSFSAKMD